MGLVLTAVILIALLVAFFAIESRKASAEEQATRVLTDARDAYDTSIMRLKADPTNADLKQQAVAAGRAYSNLTRQQQGVTIYDEMALMNDINAATAAASSAAPTKTVKERLQALDTLRSEGMISDNEYQAKRAALLAEL